MSTFWQVGVIAKIQHGTELTGLEEKKKTQILSQRHVMQIMANPSSFSIFLQ